MNEHIDPRISTGGNNPPLADQLAISEAALAAEVEAIADRANQLPRKLVDATAEADIAVIGGVIRDAGALARKIEKRRVDVKAPWLAGEQTIDGFFKGLGGRAARVATVFEGLVNDFRTEQRAKAQAIEAEVERKRRAEEQARLRAAAEAEAKGRQNTAALERQNALEAARQADEAQARAARAAAAVAAPTKTAVADGLTMTAKAEWTHEVTDQAKVDLNALRPYLKADHVELAIKLAVRMGVRAIGGVRVFQVERTKWS